MVNPEHVGIVKRGAEAIAEWRREHPTTRLELQGADLSFAGLPNTTLQGKDDGWASLNDADLSSAELRGANLRFSTMHRANLQGADLSEVDFRNADLRLANLRYSKLWYADFSNSVLDGASFQQAILGFTTLTNIDLTRVSGIDDVIVLEQEFPLRMSQVWIMRRGSVESKGVRWPDRLR